MPYIPFTEAQKLQAVAVDLPSFLARQGVALRRSGQEYRLETDPYITIKGNQWYDQAEQRGGNAVTFVRRHFGLDYPGAVLLLLGDGAAEIAVTPQPAKERKAFVLPPAHTDMRRLFAYLVRQRHIPAGIVSHFVRAKMLYESAEPHKETQKVYHNAVFVGMDEHGVPRHACKRGLNTLGATFRGNVEGSNPAHSFHHVGTSESLYVFEAPIDMLSFIALHPNGWQRHSYVALCGVAPHAMVWMLEAHPGIRNVLLCLDNDSRGQTAANRLAEQLSSRDGLQAQIVLPQEKDWNDELKIQAGAGIDCASMAEQNAQLEMRQAML